MIDGPPATSSSTSFPSSSFGTHSLKAPASSLNDKRTVILKLGGSLLSLPDLATRIASVTAQRPDGRFAVVVGGGAAADVVRDWDRAHSLGDEAAHHLALAAMRMTAEFVAACLPAAVLVETPEALQTAFAAGQLPLLATDAWLNRAEAAGQNTIPHTWEATSDSIAGWLATELAAHELILLKSVDCPSSDIRTAAAHGLVDQCFPAAAARIPRLSWVNLRSTDCRIDSWTGSKAGGHGQHRS